jgi:hypothetical protein
VEPQLKRLTNAKKKEEAENKNKKELTKDMAAQWNKDGQGYSKDRSKT